jgi:hypothetical protein
MTAEIVAKMLNVYFDSLVWRSFSGVMKITEFTLNKDSVNKCGFENDTDNQTKIFAIAKRTADNKEYIMLYVDNELSSSPPISIGWFNFNIDESVEITLTNAYGYWVYKIKSINMAVEFIISFNYKEKNYI